MHTVSILFFLFKRHDSIDNKQLCIFQKILGKIAYVINLFMTESLFLYFILTTERVIDVFDTESKDNLGILLFYNITRQ